MKGVELYGRVRYAVQIEGLSHRAAARRFGIDPRTVAKMMKFTAPPGYVRAKPPAKPKLDPFIAMIDRILFDDKSRPRKQQHTAKRIFERLRDEYGFTGGLTIVKDYVAGWRQRAQEMFVPLEHPPGHAQVDFGEAIGVIGGVERKIHFFAFDLPHSDACFVVGYPAETTEAFCDGHVRAFSFFGGVPQSILYDNTKIAVARILGDGKRQRTRGFAELQSHYLFRDRFGRPGKGNDKGQVEGLVGYARRNFLVPLPVFESFEALNAYLVGCCRRRMADRLRGHDETIAQRLERDLAAFQRPLAPAYDACEKVATRVSSRSLVRYRLNDYSVPTTYGHRDVLVRGYVHEVVISCGAGSDWASSPFLRAPRLHIRSAALPGVDRTEDQRARSGGATGRLAVAGRVHGTPASSGSPDGQAGQARVRASFAIDGSVPSRRRRCRSARRHRARSNRLRRREAPDPVPHRTATAAPRHDDLSRSAAGARHDDVG